jgi:hypothetical protein
MSIWRGKSPGEKTTHELAREMLADVDCPLSWARCRVCKKRIDPTAPSVHMGATSIMECCPSFHQECWDALTPEARAEGNKVTSVHFND